MVKILWDLAKSELAESQLPDAQLVEQMKLPNPNFPNQTAGHISRFPTLQGMFPPHLSQPIPFLTNRAFIANLTQPNQTQDHASPSFIPTSPLFVHVAISSVQRVGIWWVSPFGEFGFGDFLYSL